MNIVLTFYVTEDENKIQQLQRNWHTHNQFKIQFKKDLHFNIVLKIKGMNTYSQSSTDLCSMTIPQAYTDKIPKIFWQESLNDPTAYYSKSTFKNNNVEISYYVTYI